MNIVSYKIKVILNAVILHVDNRQSLESINLVKVNGDSAVLHVHVNIFCKYKQESDDNFDSVSDGVTTEKPSTPPPTVSPGIAAGCGKLSNECFQNCFGSCSSLLKSLNQTLKVSKPNV